MDTVTWLAFGCAVGLMSLAAIGVLAYLTKDLWLVLWGNCE